MTPKPKLIITDLDRTLLKTDKSISQYTKNIFRKAQQSGIPVIFATARSPHHISKLLDDIPADGIIANGGAIAIFRGKEIYRATLDPAIANTIITRLLEQSKDLHIAAEIGSAYLYNDFESDGQWLSEFTPGFARQWDFTTPINKPVYKIPAQCGHEEALQIAADLPDVSVIPFVGESWVCFGHANATKWQGIKALAAHLNIDPQYIAAFGDDYNDIEMLANCGMSVAVANAIPEAKAAAKFHCSSNDDDGVANWIEKNCLCETEE